MEKVIKIDGKDVKFKATANTLRIYRMKFGRDLMVDLARLAKISEKTEMEIPDLELFENIAYVMAKQADNSIPSDVGEWLDEFNVFAIREILPELLTLWNENMETTVEIKKNRQKIIEK